MVLTHRDVDGIDIVALAGRLVMADVPHEKAAEYQERFCCPGKGIEAEGLDPDIPAFP